VVSNQYFFVSFVIRQSCQTNGCILAEHISFIGADLDKRNYQILEISRATWESCMKVECSDRGTNVNE
jgi:hypothetical protein